MKWNEQQEKVINFKDGACAVMSSAGSGKTASLIERIKRLVESGVKPNDILAISFTRNTANELKDKLKKKFLTDVNVGTFHSTCIQILSKEGLNCSRQPMQFEVSNELKKLNGGVKVNTKDILGYISYQKSYNNTYEDEFEYKESDYEENELRIFYKAYEDLKEKKGYMDFDDMLIKCLNFLKENPNKYTYKYLLVDENQDSNLVQNEIARLLCPSENIMVIGDVKQSLYSFNGSFPEMFMNFDKNYKNATVINLDINYRSCKNIVDRSNKFIRPYFSEFEHYSDSIPNSDKNGEIKIIRNMDKIDEAHEIAEIIENKIKNGTTPKDIAVLFRLNSISAYIENEFKSRDIPYYIDNGGSFFKRKEIEAIMSVLRLVHNPHDDEAFAFLFKLGTTPIGFIKHSILDDIDRLAAKNNLSLFEASQLHKFSSWYQNKNMKEFGDCIHNLSDQYKKKSDLKELIGNIVRIFSIENWINNKYESKEESEDRILGITSLKEFIRSNTLESFINYVYSSNEKKKNNKDCVNLMTIHKSKGLEFKDVFVIGIENTKFPHAKSNIEEEARLFYVAVTRSKDNLYLSQIGCESTFIEQYK